jgi:hypothetical protein
MMTMSALDKLVNRCNEMDITEQINWLGDASMPFQAQTELAALRLQLAHYEIGADEQIEREKTESAQLAALRAECDELKAADAQQVDEMNAGYQAFEAGQNADNAEVEYYSALPAEVPHYDVFRVGYAWAKYQAENKGA